VQTEWHNIIVFFQQPIAHVHVDVVGVGKLNNVYCEILVVSREWDMLEVNITRIFKQHTKSMHLN
jgi:hypothetical protein